MHLFGKKAILVKEVCGIEFRNPLGISVSASTDKRIRQSCKSAGFICITPPSHNILNWIVGLQEYRKLTVLSVNLKENIAVNFSLVYDFVDFVVVSPFGDSGLNAPEISDVKDLMDELVSTRLGYENYTPIFFRLYPSLMEAEVTELVNYARLSGIDGIVVPDEKMMVNVGAMIQGRLPLVGMANSAEKALSMLQNGADLVENSVRFITFVKMLKTIEKA